MFYAPSVILPDPEVLMLKSGVLGKPKRTELTPFGLVPLRFFPLPWNLPLPARPPDPGLQFQGYNELKEKAGKLRPQLFGKTLVHPSEQITEERGIRIGIKGGGGIPIIVFAN